MKNPSDQFLLRSLSLLNPSIRLPRIQNDDFFSSAFHTDIQDKQDVYKMLPSGDIDIDRALENIAPFATNESFCEALQNFSSPGFWTYGRDANPELQSLSRHFLLNSLPQWQISATASGILSNWENGKSLAAELSDFILL